MNNPVAKVCRIIESCETEEHLIIARRVSRLAIKKYPYGESIISWNLQFVEALVEADRLQKEFRENLNVTVDRTTGKINIEAKMIMVGPCK